MRSFILILCLSFSLLSCSGDDDTNTLVKEENITLKNTEKYEYNMGSFGDEEGVRILKQARHFEISELVRDEVTFEMIYKYKPETGYTGTDMVELQRIAYDVSTGKTSSSDVVKIIFTVTE